MKKQRADIYRIYRHLSSYIVLCKDDSMTNIYIGNCIPFCTHSEPTHSITLIVLTRKATMASICIPTSESMALKQIRSWYMLARFLLYIMMIHLSFPCRLRASTSSGCYHKKTKKHQLQADNDCSSWWSCMLISTAKEAGHHYIISHSTKSWSIINDFAAMCSSLLAIPWIGIMGSHTKVDPQFFRIKLMKCPPARTTTSVFTV